MKSTVRVLEGGMQIEPVQDLPSQLEEYVVQQPASKQSFHKSMRILEWVSLALPVGVFAVALYLSFAWRTVPAQAIPTAWFCFPLSFTPFLILVGLHGIGLRAWPPTGLLGKTMRVFLPLTGIDKTLPLRVGGQAVAWGWGTVALALISGVFWGMFAQAVWNASMAQIGVLTQVLGTLLAVIIVAKIVLSIFQKLFRSR